MSDITALGFQIDPNRLSKSEVNGIRVALGVSAVVALVLGIVVLVWPDKTAGLLAVLFGLYFLIIGIVRLAKGIFSKGISGGSRVLSILLGLLLVIAGIFALRNLESTVALLGIIIGIAWIIEGVAALVESASDGSRWPGIVFGVISIIAGIVVLFLPAASVAVLLVIGGIFLVIAGLVQLVQAFTFGRNATTA
ncbi:MULTISPECIES: HdeD family acid-resistance protein [unclassified Leifsonia]|uniref:HdeD family acid-resistance protein n=1 Tax=unclassified Leifsonia TaxID=2663824 RepID=UPI0006FA9D12|nr:MULTISPECIES: DUF308 domain-containing protein [unclassified Leifsonia]KQX06993.1 hypothetical protein ASC59_04065 [Leifsonia sp. Root1293]KRA11276.1 hypothetical protein ASD61_04065 [Leifsonia sp. Root60]